MLHLKSYLGSIVLAGLLLQGCGSSTDEASTSNDGQTASEVQTAATINALTDTLSQIDLTETNATLITKKFNALKLQISASDSSTAQAASLQTAGLLSPITDKFKTTLEKLADTSVGNKVTSATFDVVLNSEGVTVVMLDAARGSHTITKVMIDALDADWSLTKKMIPMLQTNKEFGEKFAALAYEEPDMARFFFSRVDAPMYNALADAMLLSNDDSNHDASVDHSTNAYMGILMEKYALEYFVPFKSGAHKTTQKASKKEDGHKSGESVKYAKYLGNDTSGTLATDDNFVNLLADTKAVVTYDGNATFTGHGDGNELINEKFFYSLFKTPTSTDSFVAAMDKLPQATVTELMDNIFLGQSADVNDTVQGYLNIISIGSAMYDGIYGVKEGETRTNAYGFSSYAGAFVGFAGLIQGDRFMPYGKAFMNAGYEYAKFHGIDVWSGVSEAAKTAWNSYTTPADNNSSTNAPARSAGLGVVGSAWVSDSTDLLWSAYKNFDININWTDLYTAITSSDKSIMTEITNQINGLKDSGNKAYHTLLDGKDENNMTVLYTELSNGTVHNDTVFGLHGLVELAMQEDIYYVECGNRSTDYILTATPTCENNASYTMDSAKAAFTLPPFADITWSYAYGTAKNGATAYVSGIDADWIANLNNNTLITQYFTPDANNSYVPSWMLAINWLSLPKAYTTSHYKDYDYSIDFNSGYLDVYVVSKEEKLSDIINFSELTDINVSKVEMGDDTIIAVDENGQTVDAYYVYKIRVVSPAQVEAVLAKLSTYTDSVLTAVGLDSSNTANVNTTDANATTAQ